MSTFASEIDNIIKQNGERGLEVVLYYHGRDLRLMRQVVRDDAYARVHNKNAGNPVRQIKNFIGAIVGDDFFTNTVTHAGTFKSAWLYTDDQDVRPGDEVEIVRTDGRRMAYRIEDVPSIGQSTQIFTKWKLSGIM